MFLLDKLGELWPKFHSILSAVYYTHNIWYYIEQYQLLSEPQIRMINSTNKNSQLSVLTRMVADNIQRGGKKEFTRFAKFMECNWLLKFYLEYWNENCKCFIIY